MGKFQNAATSVLKRRPRDRSRFWLLVWRGQTMGEIFCLARVLPLFFDARSQLDLIRIIRPRCATRLQKSGDERDEKQYWPHVRDHARQQSAISITNPPRSPCCRLQMRSGILHRGTVQPTPFNARSRLILAHVAVRLPTTPTPAKDSQAQEGDEHKSRPTVSIRGVEFGGGH